MTGSAAGAALPGWLRRGLRAALCAAVVSLPIPAGEAAAQPAGRPEEIRRQKLRTILRTQDLRTSRDALLRRYLYDPDTLVRTRAVLAYGSLQDTTALPDLVNNLVDGPPSTQEAAAFAIGQTAGALSAAAREALGHDLVWTRLDRTAARGRLLEEFGKFGTAAGLRDLLLRIGPSGGEDVRALLMGIARFAIRGVTSEESTRLALTRLLDRSEFSWEAAYALQRIGADPLVRAELPRLIGAARHRDPLVRMQLAALFGKLGRDSSLVEPLSVMVRFDQDWRVRVNALRALAVQRPEPRTAEAFASALSGDDASVVVAALAALAGAADSADLRSPHLRSLLPAVRALAAGADRGHRWQYRSAAAMTLARLEGAGALPDIAPDPEPVEPLLAAGQIAAMGATRSREAAGPIAAFLDARDPRLRRSALEALFEIASAHRGDRDLQDRVYEADIAALGSGDMAVVTTAAGHLGDSLFLARPSVGPLVEALRRLRSPADIEAIQEICRTLGRIGDPAAAGALESVMDGGDAPAARAAADALRAVTGRDHSSRLRPDREPLHVDFDFETLEALPETVAVEMETEKGRIVMEWYRDAAPFTILSLLKLAEREGFYRGLVFHRVVPNFVVQGGDPRGDGWGGPGYSIRSEFSPITFGAGAVGIASAGKDTEGSQLFITHSPHPHLDGRYTIVGRVTSGMEAVDEIQVGDRIRDLGRIR